MKVTTSPWPFLLLAISSLPLSHSLAALDRTNNVLSQHGAALASRDNDLAAKLAQYDIGTKDAPVDGKDGKPHAGPYVDSLPDKTANRATGSMTKSDASAKIALPDDSVMNDRNRKAPSKGTTGTEGGVTEKDRDRKAREDKVGETHFKKPKSPKEPLPARAEEGLNKVDNSKGHASDSGSYSEASKDESAEKLSVPGLKKPDNLPSTPHDTKSYSEKDQSHSKHKVDDSDWEDDFFSSENAGLIPWDALMGSFSSIAATEIGDKTFIVAALMAMRHPRLQVFSAAFSALFVMTILSAVTGHAVGSLISKSWAALFAALLFLVFGGKSIKEGLEMDPSQGVGEEMAEVEAELEEKEVDMARTARRRASSISPYALEAGRNPRPASGTNLKRSDSESPSRINKTQGASLSGAVAGIKNLLGLVLSPAWVETFSMTFIGELGDRSQIATVAMAAGQEYFWVMVGATLGHFVCTGVAVLGGSVLAGRITMRKVTLIGGAIFIGFGLFTLVEAVHYFV